MGIRYYITAIIVGLFLGGCSVASQKTIIVASDIDLFTKNSGKSLHDKNSTLPTTVAIIPFDAENEHISKTVTRHFYNSFSALKYKDVELDTINRVLDGKKITNLEYSDIKKLSEILDVDGIVIGKVTDFDKLYAGLYSSVTVGATISFYNTRTDKKIWYFNENAKKREGGISFTPIGLATQLVLAAYNLREVQMYRAAEDLFRDVFKTIPSPKYSTYENPPTIKFSIDNLKEKKAFKSGDKLVFSIDSQVGLDIYATIPSEVNLQKFKEIQDGHYELEYTIDTELKDISGYVKFMLKKKNGLDAQYSNFKTKLHIDNIPPKTPKIEYFIDDNKVKIIFENMEGDEIKSYFTKILVNGVYKTFKQTKSNEIEFDLQKGEKIFLKAFSMDLAGNKSSGTHPILIANMRDSRVLKAQDLNKEIINDEIFKIAKITGNTQISGKLRIHPNGVLFIESGANIKFTKNGQIINNGGEINIYAKDNNPVNISSSSEKSIFELNKGVSNFKNINVNSKKVFTLNNNAVVNISNANIKSVFASIKLYDSSIANIEQSYFEAKNDMANILVEGASSINLIDVKFGKKTTFDMTINSTKMSYYTKPQEKLNILGEINVKE